jgi:hypothetical protein
MLAAQRAGVDVGWFSAFSKAAGDYGVGVDALSQAMKFLERNAADAVEGNKPAIEHFAQLGMSVDFLKAHLDDVQGLFTRTIEGMGKLGNESDKTAVSMNIFGRSGDLLKPLFDDGGRGANDLAAKITDLGGAFTGNDVKIANSISDMAVQWDALTTGLEKDVAIPIFKWIEAHQPQIEADLKSVAHWLQDEIPQAIDTIGQHLKDLKPYMDEMGDIFHEIQDQFQPTSSGGTRLGDSVKQYARDEFGSFPVDLWLKATGSEDINGRRLWNDIWNPNEDGVYDGHPRQLNSQKASEAEQNRELQIHLHNTINVKGVDANKVADQAAEKVRSSVKSALQGSAMQSSFGG